MTWQIITWLSVGCATIPFALYLKNRFFYGAPNLGEVPFETDMPVSILIPARNEERSIGKALAANLKTERVPFEIVVLDDHSTDRTAEIVQEFQAQDARVRLEMAPPLPDGWCGKQHACFRLSQLAKYEHLLFVDADVRLSPDAVYRMLQFKRDSKADLVSGFPRQETHTILEKLIIPLIHFLLLGFLPILMMRKSRLKGFAAGCGQLFLADKTSYNYMGGHATIRESLHDGITLPRAYRHRGLMTDICDATELAVCRMYQSAGEVWRGFTKNAREGLAANGTILPFTFLLFLGQIFPWWNLLVQPTGSTFFLLSLTAIVMSLAIRLDAAWRFRQSWLGALLHPIGVTFVLAIQWYAIFRELTGNPVGWRGRSHPSVGLSKPTYTSISSEAT